MKYSVNDAAPVALRHKASDDVVAPAFRHASS